MSEQPNTLTPRGATLLREARDYIVAHPETFDMGEWWCGSYMCIGGTIEYLECQRRRRLEQVYFPRMPYERGSHFVYSLLGFERKLLGPGDPAYDLFFKWTKDRNNVHLAAVSINAFLQYYGYPIDEPAEFPEPEPELEPEPVLA